MKIPEDFRPYAAPSNVLSVIDRARTRNLPESIDNDFLRIAGVPEISYSRVKQALLFLNLIYEDERPHENLVALAKASDSQYKEILEKIVREAYKEQFNMVDPSKDPQNKIMDAFQPYSPRSQTQRMVMMFLSLCKAAGIPVLDAPRERSMKDSLNKVANPPTVTQKSKVSSPKIRTSGMPDSDAIIFGVTESDLAALGHEQFNEVWTALGKVALARAKAKQQDSEESKREISEKSEESKDNLADK